MKEEHRDLIEKASTTACVESVEKLITYYTPLFRSIARKYSQLDTELYDDLVQECRIKFAELIKAYDASLSVFGYYVKLNIERHINDLVKKYYYKSDNVPLSDFIIDSDDAFERINLHNAIASAVEMLPDQQKLAIKLYYYMDLPQDEASEYMNIKQPAFSRLVKRGLKKIRENLKTM
jgi:RNA polymerase sigma factor (sigma-70 family)